MATFPPPQPCCRRSNLKGNEILVFETAAGQQITMQSTPAAVVIEDGNGNTVRLDASGISIMTSAKLSITAPQAEISAAALTVNAGVASFSGLLRADTVQANTVIAANITPAAGGNIW
jgi:hypothetical protein